MDERLNSEVLVSVVVVTYNSSEFIIDTLESIKNQTYPNIELIISDDCSGDDTVKVCKEWIETNEDRFVRAEVVTSPVNTGVAPNFNRGIERSQGEWIKTIGGDDALYPDVIEQYLNFASKHHEVQFLHSRAVNFSGNFDEENKLDSPPSKNLNINRPGITAQEQFQILLRTCNIAAPTVMIKRSVLEKVGLFNEEYPMWEDTPMWIKITKNNIKLYYLDIFGAKYRIRVDSVIRENTKSKILSNFSMYRSRAYMNVCLPHISGFEKLLKISALRMNELFYKLNNNSVWVRGAYSVLAKPLMYLVHRINKSYKYG
ncbi:glycosyltransferase [Salinimicrobium sp. CDJ15-81-2]|nr:glycosyltransferase [Salinimicrobium nanhaiense]